jgi:hypothetical protein
MNAVAVPVSEAKGKRWLFWVGWVVSLWPVFVSRRSRRRLYPHWRAFSGTGPAVNEHDCVVGNLAARCAPSSAAPDPTRSFAGVIWRLSCISEREGCGAKEPGATFESKPLLTLRGGGSAAKDLKPGH